MVSAAATETLERDRELDSIAAALDCAAAGAGRLVVIEGPPGIGKTRLIEDARALAKARRFGRVSATGYQSERTLAWGVVRQLVERRLLRFAPDVRESILAGPVGRALEILDRAPSGVGADEAALAPTLHALWWVAADVSALRPVLITVDDVQWADGSSLHFLAYLARRIGDLAIALVVTTRLPDREEPALSELVALGSGERVVPRPLSEDAVAALATAGAGVQPAAPVVHALYRASGGNPFHAGQLLKELEALDRELDDPRTAAVVEGLGPTAIARTLLGRLGPDALALAKVMAVTGFRDGPALPIELAGFEHDVAARAVDELVAAHVLSRTDELAFTHPVVHGAVLGAMGPGERGAIHARVARRLAERAVAADRVAAHLIMAPHGVLPDAAHWLRTAARALLAAGDAPSAAAHLRRAVEESPGDADLTAELGEALLRAGEPADARDRLRDAARAATTPLERARRFASAAWATLALDGPGVAVAELRELLEGGEGTDDPAARVLLEARLGGVASFDPEELRRSARRLAVFADLPGATRDERALLALLARIAWAEVRPAAEVAALARRAVGDGAWVGEEPAAFAAFAGAIHALIMADDLAAARRDLDAARLAARDGAPRDFVLVSTCLAFVSWREGSLDATVADASAAIGALELADRDPAVAAMHAIATRVLVLALVEMGDLAGAREAMETYDAAAVDDGPTIPRHRLRQARAGLALAVGDPGVARAEAEALGAVERSAGADNPSIPWRSLAALGAARLGDDRTARALAAEQLELARAWGAPTDLGAALRLVARLEPEGRLARLQEAVTVLEQAPSRLELAHALAELGGALRVDRRRAEAREPLRRATELAQACGARVLQTQALDALAALGDRPRKLMFSGTESLTGSERRVAELAAAGHSNREIAQELFVTPKTVENHLGRIYMKLGIGGRRELTAALTAA